MADAYDFDQAMWDPEGPPSRGSDSGSGAGDYEGVRYRTYLWHEFDKDGSKNDPVHYRFLGDPNDEEANKAGYWVFVPHQVSVRDGIEGILSMPRGVSAVPLRGAKDPLLKRVVKGRYNIDSQTKEVKTQAAVLGLFADEQDRLQILELTARQWRALCSRLTEWREDFEDPDWSLVGRPITIQKEGVKGTPGASTLVIKRVAGQKPTPVDQLPEGYNLREHLAEVRQAVDDALGVQRDENEVVKPIAEVTPESKDTGDTTPKVRLSTLDTDELRELLTNAGIEYPAKARKPVLLQKAADAGLGIDETTDEPPF